MNNQKLTFLVKILILSFPLFILLGLYLYWDPFKVLYKYDSYYESGKPSYVTLNKGYVSLETLLRNQKKHEYDSFIFGSSRSMFYRVDDWKKFIQAKACFHFDASGESVYGVFKKVKYLEKRGILLKNVLFVVDPELLSQPFDSESHLRIQHPILTGESVLLFQMKFLKTYLDWKFLIPFLDLKLSGKFHPYMKRELVLNDTPFKYDLSTNEQTLDCFEEEINKNMNEYYEKKKDVFYKRNIVQRYSNVVIGEEQKRQLAYIMSRFKENGTVYKIIISPLYDQKKLSLNDYVVLCQIFGSENVFDFSGINDLTSTIYNYYETSHYRPHVCKWILEYIYKFDDIKKMRM